jgi:hypothetical protein
VKLPAVDRPECDYTENQREIGQVPSASSSGSTMPPVWPEFVNYYLSGKKSHGFFPTISFMDVFKDYIDILTSFLKPRLKWTGRRITWT